MTRSTSLFLATAVLALAQQLGTARAADPATVPAPAPAGAPAATTAPAPASAQPPASVEVTFVAQKMKEENVEGPDVERTYFLVGSKRMVYGLPKGSQLTVGDGFILRSEDPDVDGEIHVTRSPFTPDMDLASNALKYRESAASTLPPDVPNPQTVPPVLDPYPFNGWKSLGFTWNFNLYGRNTVKTVSYLNLNGVQLMITTISAQKDADKIQKMAKSFIASWWLLGRNT